MSYGQNTGDISKPVEKIGNEYTRVLLNTVGDSGRGRCENRECIIIFVKNAKAGDKKY